MTTRGGVPWPGTLGHVAMAGLAPPAGTGTARAAVAAMRRTPPPLRRPDEAPDESPAETHDETYNGGAMAGGPLRFREWPRDGGSVSTMRHLPVHTAPPEAPDPEGAPACRRRWPAVGGPTAPICIASPVSVVP